MLVFRLIHDTAEGEQHSDLSVEAKQVEVVDLIETPLEGSVHLLLGACDIALRYTISYPRSRAMWFDWRGLALIAVAELCTIFKGLNGASRVSS